MHERNGRARRNDSLGSSATYDPSALTWGTLRADVLAATAFPPLQWSVPRLLPEGLTLFAGKPKFGKSYAVLDMALAVASGGKALGVVQCDPADVLYCAFEDSGRRLRDRLVKMHPYGATVPKRLMIETEAVRIGAGLVERLSGWLDAHPEGRQIWLDTWRTIKPEGTGRKSQYDEDAAAIAPLHRLALSRPGLAIGIVHHTRKMEADDPFDAISGTHGLTGVPDTIIVLARDGEGAKMEAQGRDLEPYAKALKRDQMTGGWKIVGDVREMAKTGERQAVLDVLMEADGQVLTAGMIAKGVGKKGDVVSHLLKGLFAEGLVLKPAYGKYTINPSNRSDCSIL